MKILFVQRVKAYAGSERYFTTIIPELIRRGIDCKLLFVVHPKDYHKLSVMEEKIREHDIPYQIIFARNNLSLHLLKKLNRAATADNYDLIHLHLIHAELWFSLIKKFINKSLTLVSTIHGFDEAFQAKYGFDPTKVTNTRYVRILKFNQTYIRRYYAVSKGLMNLMVESGIIPKEKITVIYYGFDYPQENHAIPENAGIKILVPGRIVPYKGQDLMMKALPEILEQFPAVQCEFAGDFQGDFGHRLQQLAANLGITDSVRFLGHVNSMDALYNSASVVVLPSRSEGFGLVLMEAFNAEKPVVTFDVPAFNEVIENEKTGLLCKAFDTTELACNILKLLQDPDLCTKLTRNAKQRLLDYYCLDRMASETVAFYKDVISASK